MRLFEDEISETIATDGPCEVLCVDERVTYDGRGDDLRRRTFGVVIFRAKSRMYPRQGTDGQWRVAESAVETKLVLLRASLTGNELPREAGRYLGTYRENGVHWYAFLARKPQDVLRPEGSEVPAGATGRGPAKEGGPARAPSSGGQRANPPPAGRTSTHGNSEQPGRP